MYSRIHGPAAIATFLALLLCGSAAATGTREGEALRGRNGAYSWSLAAGAPHGDPCLEVSIVHRHGRFGFDRTRFRHCVPRLRSAGPALIAGGRELGRGADGMTVLALAFSPGVARARLVFAGGRVETRRVRSLPRAPGGTGFVTLAGRADLCLTGVTSLGAGGAALWRESAGACLPRVTGG
jgi:hypothetical protein